MNPQPESMWTEPSEWCPHPERWHAHDPQSTELEVVELVGGFIRALQPGYVVETGSCIGMTSRMIGLALQANGHGSLDTIETDGLRCKATVAACEGLPVKVHCKSSLEFEPADTIGFAWFDTRTDLRVAEFERYFPWMVTGTMVGFHDTGPQFGNWATNIRSLPMDTIQLRTPRGVTFGVVR